MTLETQFRLKSNPNYIRYIRENSYWYKNLNRNPDTFSLFEQEVKERYGLRPSDKINRALQTFELLQNVLSSLK